MPFILEITLAKDPRDTHKYTDDPINHIMTRTPERWYTLDGNLPSLITRNMRLVEIVVEDHYGRITLEFPSRRQAHVWVVHYRFINTAWLPECESATKLDYPESRRVLGYEWDGSQRIGRYVDFGNLDSDREMRYRLLYDERVDAR